MTTQAAAVDVTRLIDDNRIGTFQIRVLLLCAAVTCVPWV